MEEGRRACWAHSVDARWNMLSAMAGMHRRIALPVVPELKLHAEILALEQGDRLLQIVARRAAHSDLFALNRGLHLLELRVLDGRGDFLCGLAIELHLELHVAAHGIARCLLDLADVEILHRHAAL